MKTIDVKTNYKHFHLCSCLCLPLWYGIAILSKFLSKCTEFLTIDKNSCRVNLHIKRYYFTMVRIFHKNGSHLRNWCSYTVITTTKMRSLAYIVSKTMKEEIKREGMASKMHKKLINLPGLPK